MNLAMRYSPFRPSLFKVILAQSHRTAGDLDAAMRFAKQVRSKDPGDVFARLVLAACHAERGSVGEAARIAEEVRQIEPGFSLDRFAGSQPYRDRESLDRFVALLRGAGLPD